MAALDLDNYHFAANPLLRFARDDLNTLIRSCYATNESTNNRIMTIEEDDEDAEDSSMLSTPFDHGLNPSLYFERRNQRIEDWNKAYSAQGDQSGERSDTKDESVRVGTNSKEEGNGSVCEGKGQGVQVKNHKYLSVTFADERGYSLYQNFIIENISDESEEENDEAEQATDDDEAALQEGDEGEDSDKENNIDLSNRDEKWNKEEDDNDDVELGYKTLESTINKLINNVITLSDSSEDVDLCGGSSWSSECVLGGGWDVDIGSEVDLEAGVAQLSGHTDDVMVGGDLGVMGGLAGEVVVGRDGAENILACKESAIQEDLVGRGELSCGLGVVGSGEKGFEETAAVTPASLVK